MALCRASLLILFVGVLLLNLMALTPTLSLKGEGATLQSAFPSPKYLHIRYFN